MWKRSWIAYRGRASLATAVDVINPAVDGSRLSRGKAMQGTKEVKTNSIQ